LKYQNTSTLKKGLSHYKLKCSAGIGLLLVLMVVFKICIPLIPYFDSNKSHISIQQAESDEKKAESEPEKDQLKSFSSSLYSNSLHLTADLQLIGFTVHRIQYTMVYCLDVIIPPPDTSLNFV